MLTERVRNLVPYVPGEQPAQQKWIKLNTNENPYPPAPAIKDYLCSLDTADLRLYPDNKCTRPRETIAERYGVARDQVFISNGSDELLAFCFYAFFESGRGPLLFPDITYSFYPVYCNLYGIEYREIPLEADFSLSLRTYLDYKKSTGLILANPNAPTGKALSALEIRRYLDTSPADRVLVVDEAYVDFGAESCVPFIDEYPNLFVIKTMSKAYSLAGMRLGYAFGQKHLIDAVETVKDSFNSYPVSRIGQKIATLAVSDREYHRVQCERIIATRERTARALKAIGWECTDSRSNFLFARKPGMKGSVVQETLREKGILVRRFSTPRIEDWLRISIGSDDEMERFLDICGDMK